jgi:hypothetical protein
LSMSLALTLICCENEALQLILRIFQVTIVIKSL